MKDKQEDVLDDVSSTSPITPVDVLHNRIIRRLSTSEENLDRELIYSDIINVTANCRRDSLDRYKPKCEQHDTNTNKVLHGNELDT